MAIMEVRTYPDPVLRIPTTPVTDFGESLEKLIEDMRDTMSAYNGVGLAAPQVGVSLQIAVISWEEHDYVLVNPRLTLPEGGETLRQEEGCLSFPDIFVEVTRPSVVEVDYHDEKGVLSHLRAEGFLARIVCHELEHLDATLLIDNVTPLKRAFLKKKMARAKKKEDENAPRD